MNGIDISSYQTGIDLTAVPCDFVIVKATQDTAYVNPDFHRAMKQGLAAGKLMGAYHYAGGADPVKEARHFLAVCKDYLGRCILCLDWESTQNASYGTNDAKWCITFLDYVRQETGVTGFLYISAGLRDKMAPVLATYHSWIAQYSSYDAIKGYQKRPWNEGAYPCEIRQYTSQLWLPGYSSHLDGNKAYITAEEWMEAQGFAAAVPAAPEATAGASFPLVRKGDKGKLVKALQTMLILADEPLKYGADGDFGSATDSALRSFQRSAGLVADGIAGERTWKALIFKILGVKV